MGEFWKASANRKPEIKPYNWYLSIKYNIHTYFSEDHARSSENKKSDSGLGSNLDKTVSTLKFEYRFSNKKVKLLK